MFLAQLAVELMLQQLGAHDVGAPRPLLIAGRASERRSEMPWRECRTDCSKLSVRAGILPRGVS